MTNFTKYEQKGAYHWREVSLHPLHGWPYTRSRVSWVVERCAEAASVLEVGCGDGVILGRLAARGVRVVGVEAEPVGLRLAREMFAQRGLAGEFHADLGALKGQVFDTVVLAEVIEHVEEPEPMLGDIARLLAPGGRLVLTTPVRLTEVSPDPHHCHEYWPHELETLLSRYFQEVTADRFHAAWFVDLLCWGVGNSRPVAVAANLLKAMTGVELIDRLPSPLRLYWTQGLVCRSPRLPASR